MPARIIGMIGVSPPASEHVVSVIAGTISTDYVASSAREHEAAGYDQVLIGYYSSSAEGFSVAQFAAAQTETLNFLVAHRPGVAVPTLAARWIATADHFVKGRLTIHFIAGNSDKEQQSEGDFLNKDDRYRRASEYLDVLTRIWTSDAPIDFEGNYYRLRGAWSEIKPLQAPHPALSFGGTSEGALEMGSRYCDIFAMLGEPLAEAKAQTQEFGRRAAAYGRRPRFSCSFRPIIAETESKAWAKAEAILAGIERRKPTTSNTASRLLSFAERGAVLDDRLWMAIAQATGAKGNTTCLVGTPEQVADSILKYYRLGIDAFLLRGFDPIHDVTELGRELIPRIKKGAEEIDRAMSAAEAPRARHASH